jgi:hypothetical protein
MGIPKYTELNSAMSTENKENLYKATYVGSGTFIISKPKRNKRKLRQLRLKSPNTGMRK